MDECAIGLTEKNYKDCYFVAVGEIDDCPYEGGITTKPCIFKER